MLMKFAIKVELQSNFYKSTFLRCNLFYRMGLSDSVPMG